MAVDGYMWFMDYNKSYLRSESQVKLPAEQTGKPEPLWTSFFDKAFKEYDKDKGGALFEIDDFSFGIEQTLNIGSQSSGSGAGKVTFNPFSITRKIDRSSPILFNLACSGTPFMQVVLGLRKSSGAGQSGRIFLAFVFKLVAVKTINWAYSDESPTETIEFEYGGIQCHYSQQQPDGGMKSPIPGGWNRVKNKQDTLTDDSSMIK